MQEIEDEEEEEEKDDDRERTIIKVRYSCDSGERESEMGWVLLRSLLRYSWPHNLGQSTTKTSYYLLTSIHSCTLHKCIPCLLQVED